MLEQASIDRVGEDACSAADALGGYRRFKLETKEALPRREQPRPFNPRVSKIGLARVLVKEVFRLRLKLRQKEQRAALLSRPCIYGTFSGRFGGFHPLKDRCTGCLRCVQENPGICNVERNPAFFKFADSYWIPDNPKGASYSPVSTVAYEASTGKIPIKGMGYKGDFAGPGWDSMWTDMSEIVRPTRDGVYGREYISTVADLGRKAKFLEFSNTEWKSAQRSRAIEVPLPIIFDYLPPNLNNQSVSNSIALASQQSGTFFVATPEQAANLSESHSGNMVRLLSPSDVTLRRDTISSFPAVELSEYDGDVIKQIRSVNPRVPVSIRLPLTKRAGQAAVEFAKAGVDAIHLCANYHGKGEGGIFVRDFIRSVHGALVKEALRDDVTVIASGGITLAEHVPKAIACGADLVAIDTTVLVALQAEFDGECESAETGKIRPDKFDPRWGEQRLVNLLAAWHDQLIEILSAMGMRDVRRLRGDVGRVMFNEDLEKEAFAEIARA